LPWEEECQQQLEIHAIGQLQVFARTTAFLLEIFAGGYIAAYPLNEFDAWPCLDASSSSP